MRKLVIVAGRKTLLTICALACAVPALAFRPPAVPLVTVDPFFSVWSAADRLTDVETTHWTGARQPVTVLLEADGRTWRLCGATPADVPALPQLTTEVRSTQTVCTFAEGALHVELRFSTAKLPDDLDVFSRPVTYVTARVQGARTWRLKPSISPALATNDDAAPMVTNRTEVAGLPAVSIGRRDQTPLGRCGDRLRCDWGYAWLVGPSAPAAGESHFLLAYDDVKSIRFFGQDLPAWWRRGGLAFTDMLAAALRDRADLLAKLDRFDAELARDLARVGGEKYAALACLSYRQSFAACKLVADPNGQPFYFSKENGSGGLIGTTDVFYPQLPHLLLTSPALAKLVLGPCHHPADTWAQKYNLVWDRILGLGLFPASVAEGELNAYRQLLLPYGLPLDSRLNYTKADWTVWSATLTGKRDDFEAIVAPLYRFADETPDRVPFTDWYWADNGRFRGFIARSVVGGLFIPALYDRDLWKKYASRGADANGAYAPIK